MTEEISYTDEYYKALEEAQLTPVTTSIRYTDVGIEIYGHIHFEATTFAEKRTHYYPLTTKVLIRALEGIERTLYHELALALLSKDLSEV